MKTLEDIRKTVEPVWFGSPDKLDEFCIDLYSFFRSFQDEDYEPLETGGTL